MSIKKRGVPMRLSLEAAGGRTLAFWSSEVLTAIEHTLRANAVGAKRRTHGVKIEEPSAEALAAWDEANSLYQELRDSEFWEEGPDGGDLQERPEPREVPIYAETEEEFRARVNRKYEKLVAEEASR